MLCVCVCVFVSCVLRGSFRLIKEMIYRSMMLEEFPDRSSNHVSSNELSPLNHSRPPKKLAPKTHPYVHTGTHTRICLYTCYSTSTRLTVSSDLSCVTQLPVRFTSPSPMQMPIQHKGCNATTLIQSDFTGSHKGL